MSSRPYDRPEYAVWCMMKQRCGNPRNAKYARYGGRGIRVCERWASSFEDFIADMGPRPSGEHSIDRVDNDGNYEPGNCRWATRTEQGHNRHTSFQVRGLSQTIEFTCAVCGCKATRKRKYVSSSSTCSRKCAGVKAGRASGTSRRKAVAA